jgi:acetyl-CoA carboxylase carboxyl transferase subunit alpha
MADDRAEFVSVLFSRPRPTGLGPQSTAGEIFSAFGAAPASQMLYAENLRAMVRFRVPIVSVVIGEGGSGGALGIGVGDRMGMFEHSIFSVISPEGCATILWKTSANAQAAAAALKLRAADLLQLGLIDEIIPEPIGGAHRNHAQAAAALGRFVVRSIDELSRLPHEALLQRRFQRLRDMGSSFQEAGRIRHSA